MNFDVIKYISEPTGLVFPNNGVLADRVPQSIYDTCLDTANYIFEEGFKAPAYNKNLLGHIKNEYVINELKPILQSYIVGLCDTHNRHFRHLDNISVLTSNKKYVLDEVWINFQKKHEFNPPHVHSGIYSYVIWLKIPFDIEDEKKVFPDAKQSTAGTFNFSYTDIMGNVKQNTINVDKKFEGIILLFPSLLTHYVNPFYTSDKYRITLAGNVLFDVG